MKNSRFRHKRVLGIDGQLEILLSIEKYLKAAYIDCQFDKALNFDDGFQLLYSYNYDLILLDITSEPGSKLLDVISNRKFPVLAMSKNGAFPEELCIYNGVRIIAFLQKTHLKQVNRTVEQALMVNLLSQRRSAHRVLKEYVNRIFRSMIPKNLDPKETSVISY